MPVRSLRERRFDQSRRHAPRFEVRLDSQGTLASAGVVGDVVLREPGVVQSPALNEFADEGRNVFRRVPLRPEPPLQLAPAVIPSCQQRDRRLANVPRTSSAPATQRRGRRPRVLKIRVIAVRHTSRPQPAQAVLARAVSI